MTDLDPKKEKLLQKLSVNRRQLVSIPCKMKRLHAYLTLGKLKDLKPHNRSKLETLLLSVHLHFKHNKVNRPNEN